MIALRRVAPKGGARILLTMESENPTGSMKDRMALAMIEAAEADGRLKPNGVVVEYTGLALVCAVKGYALHIVTPDAFSKEKLDHAEAGHGGGGAGDRGPDRAGVHGGRESDGLRSGMKYLKTFAADV